MLPDPKTARIVRLESQALNPLFERMKELALVSRARRLEAFSECQGLLEQFRVAYAERSRPSPHTERMLQLLEGRIREFAEAPSEPVETGRCGVCGSTLETTGIGTFCPICLDALLQFYGWLESENSSFSRTGHPL